MAFVEVDSILCSKSKRRLLPFLLGDTAILHQIPVFFLSLAFPAACYIGFNEMLAIGTTR